VIHGLPTFATTAELMSTLTLLFFSDFVSDVVMKVTSVLGVDEQNGAEKIVLPEDLTAAYVKPFVVVYVGPVCFCFVSAHDYFVPVRLLFATNLFHQALPSQPF
jgi:hypothetical protein